MAYKRADCWPFAAFFFLNVNVTFFANLYGIFLCICKVMGYQGATIIFFEGLLSEFFGNCVFMRHFSLKSNIMKDWFLA